MRQRCGVRELDDHAEAGDLAVALEARPDDRAVEKGGPDAWATAGPRGDPLLAPRRDGVEFVGSSGKTNGWDASTSAKSEGDGDGCNTRFIKEHKPSNHIRARIKSHVYTTE